MIHQFGKTPFSCPGCGLALFHIMPLQMLTVKVYCPRCSAEIVAEIRIHTSQSSSTALEPPIPVQLPQQHAFDLSQEAEQPPIQRTLVPSAFYRAFEQRDGDGDDDDNDDDDDDEEDRGDDVLF